MKKQGKKFQIKENKSPEINTNEIEICDFPNGEFKITVLKVPTEVRK